MARTSGTRPKGLGPGWGGLAKGAGTGGPAKAFTIDTPTNQLLPGAPGVLGAAGGDPVKKLNREEKAARDEERVEAYKQIIHDIAVDPTTSKELKLVAVEKGLDRIEGRPTQKTQLTGADDGPVKVEEIRRVIIDPEHKDG